VAESLGLRYDGLTARDLRDLLDLPGVELRDTVSSTLDVAHTLAAAGAPAGTLVVADEQTAGRGRGGRRWSSPSGAGLWFTLIERPRQASAAAVLSLRLGIYAARVLDRFARTRVALKWPNDLYLDGGKLGGVLVESRWREERLDWTAIGIGINVRAPAGIARAAALGAGSSRAQLLSELVPAVRAAVAAAGPLTAPELQAFAARDLAQGRVCSEPAEGVVVGIGADGALLVRVGHDVVACRSGSLVLEGEEHP
jgi:BirA family biotin operon repressor/biotin-[acetyl-CoA-carboxylase] ligase